MSLRLVTRWLVLFIISDLPIIHNFNCYWRSSLAKGQGAFFVELLYSLNFQKKKKI